MLVGVVRSPTLQQHDENLSLSPVYSLAVHSQGLWLLSGLDSGGINLQSVRHDEGKRITCLRKHTSAVSVLTLSQDEKSVLSGSWDKMVYDWDLNTGQIKRAFEGSGGQISAIEPRPLSSLPVPEVTEEPAVNNGTMSSNPTARALRNGTSMEMTGGGIANPNPEMNGENVQDPQGSPTHSLFSGNDADSLFGEYDDKPGPGPLAENHFGEDDDDEFSRAIAHGFQQQDQNAAGNDQPDDAAVINETGEGFEIGEAQNGHSSHTQPGFHAPVAHLDEQSISLANGLPSQEDMLGPSNGQQPDPDRVQDTVASSDSTFFAASIDGTIRIWDRRQPQAVASILPRHVPPWCMNACWSPDGNYIYAGRRNGTVEEFNLHKGLRDPERTFRFPQGSGPVSAVKAMPNGRHLIW